MNFKHQKYLHHLDRITGEEFTTFWVKALMYHKFTQFFLFTKANFQYTITALATTFLKKPRFYFFPSIQDPVRTGIEFLRYLFIIKYKLECLRWKEKGIVIGNYIYINCIIIYFIVDYLTASSFNFLAFHYGLMASIYLKVSLQDFLLVIMSVNNILVS